MVTSPIADETTSALPNRWRLASISSHHLLQRPGGQGPFDTRQADAPEQLLPVILLTPAIALDHHQRGTLDALVSGEADTALEALSTPADPLLPYTVSRSRGTPSFRSLDNAWPAFPLLLPLV